MMYQRVSVPVRGRQEPACGLYALLVGTYALQSAVADRRQGLRSGAPEIEHVDVGAARLARHDIVGVEGMAVAQVVVFLGELVVCIALPMWAI